MTDKPVIDAEYRVAGEKRIRREVGWAAGIAVALVLVATSTAQARYTQTSRIKIGDGEWMSADVTFVTGSEMNKATSSYSYDQFSNYAVVFWGPKQASVVKLSGYSTCSGEFTRSCLPSYGDLSGEDQESRDWDICTGDTCS